MLPKLLPSLENLLVNEINEVLARLKTSLNEEPLVQEYFMAKDLVFNDPFLLNLAEKIKALQKEITRNVLDINKHQALTNEYQKLKAEYDTHPYVVNYNALLCDVNELLSELKSIIE